jgi:hypothetical protein
LNSNQLEKSLRLAFFSPGAEGKIHLKSEASTEITVNGMPGEGHTQQ